MHTYLITAKWTCLAIVLWGCSSKDQVALEVVMEKYGIRDASKRSHDELSGVCPIHGDPYTPEKPPIGVAAPQLRTDETGSGLGQETPTQILTIKELAKIAAASLDIPLLFANDKQAEVAGHEMVRLYGYPQFQSFEQVKSILSVVNWTVSPHTIGGSDLVLKCSDREVQLASNPDSCVLVRNFATDKKKAVEAMLMRFKLLDKHSSNYVSIGKDYVVAAANTKVMPYVAKAIDIAETSAPGKTMVVTWYVGDYNGEELKRELQQLTMAGEQESTKGYDDEIYWLPGNRMLVVVTAKKETMLNILKVLQQLPDPPRCTCKRDLQRCFELALIVVHHTSKKAHAQPGQSLRGSSDLHAFGDSNAYLARKGADVLLTLEHRSARAPEPMVLRLACLEDGTASHLELLSAVTTDTAEISLERRLADLLRRRGPLPRTQLRSELRINNHRLGEPLIALEKAGEIRRTQDGWGIKIPQSDSRHLA